MLLSIFNLEMYILLISAAGKHPSTLNPQKQWGCSNQSEAPEQLQLPVDTVRQQLWLVLTCVREAVRIIFPRDFFVFPWTSSSSSYMSWETHRRTVRFCSFRSEPQKLQSPTSDKFSHIIRVDAAPQPNCRDDFCHSDIWLCSEDERLWRSLQISISLTLLLASASCCYTNNIQNTWSINMLIRAC